MPPNSEIEKLERRWRDNPKGTVFAPYAEVLRKNGDHALARDVLRQGLELHPDHIPGNIVLGRCCLDLGEDGPAEAAFAHVLDLDSENVIALKALADITERQGRLAEADNWLNRLITVDPSNDEAREQFSRVNAAREAAAAALTSEVVAASAAPAAKTAEVRVDELVAQDKLEAQDRSEVASGTIDDVSDVAAFADEALDNFLGEEPAAPTIKPAAVTEEVTAVRPAWSAPPPAPESLAGLEPAGLDLSEAPDLEPITDLKVDEAFTPPAPETPAAARPSGPFAIGTEPAPDIDIQPTGVSEFQTPDDSTALLDLKPGSSEFQVPDASAEIAISSGGSSEFQTPDASEELRVSGHGSSEYQTPSGAEELLRSAAAAETSPEPEAELEPEDSPAMASWSTTEVTGTIATMAAMPTQEIPTEPPSAEAAPADAPSWFFDEVEPAEAAAAAPPADLPLIEPEPETTPEPVAEAGAVEPPLPEPAVAEAEPAQESEPQVEPVAEPVAEASARGSAELKLIFPDDAARPEPHRVRRITQADLAQPDEPAEAPVGEPEPIMTETMAELYARQGHTAEALKVYRALSAQAPGDARLRERIRELEARSASVARRHAYMAADTGGESVESFFRSLADARPGSGPAPAGFEAPHAGGEDNGGAPTRPARDPLSLSAIFGEEPQAAAARKAEPAPAPAPPPGPDAFSFDQFFGAPPSPGPSAGPSRPSGASDEDLDQFQNWLKSLKR
jgi:hypothetical protein